jgi:hypothetical protein
MIEPQPSARAQFLSTSGAAGTTVNAGRHDDSMPGVRVSDRGIDQQDSTVTRPKSNSRFYQELCVLAKHRRGQGSTASLGNRECISFVRVWDKSRDRTKYLNLIRHLRRIPCLPPQ